MPVEVTINFVVEPATATITINGKPVDKVLVTPKFAEPQALSITAAGFASHTAQVVFDTDQRIVVSLAKAAAPTRPTRPTRPARPKQNQRIDSQSPYGNKD